MNPTHRGPLAATILALCLASPAWAASDLAISQVYGGGGNSGAPFNRDFVEVFNRGPVPASLNGLSVQYASSAGSFNNVATLPDVTLQPGQYFLLQLSGGTTGAGLGAGCTAGRSGGLSSTRTASPIRLSISSIGSGSRRGSGAAGLPRPNTGATAKRSGPAAGFGAGAGGVAGRVPAGLATSTGASAPGRGIGVDTAGAGAGCGGRTGATKGGGVAGHAIEQLGQAVLAHKALSHVGEGDFVGVSLQ